jgi:hypothetical protein
MPKADAAHGMAVLIIATQIPVELSAMMAHTHLPACASQIQKIQNLEMMMTVAVAAQKIIKQE